MSESPPWRIVVTPQAEKELKRLPVRDQARVRTAIDTLATAPRRADVRKPRGSTDEWRLRVGDWRVRFRMDSAAKTLVILRVLPRGGAYR